MRTEETVGNSLEQRTADRKHILEILNRAFCDDIFCMDLLERGEMILKKYTLSREAKSALLSGDVKWIKEHVGKLTNGQTRYLTHRLETET
jgi:hypothetical protein